MTEFSIVVPAFNEEGNIELLLAEIRRAAPSVETIVVDDGSSDRTVARLSAIKDPFLKIVRHERRRGKTHALKTGIALASHAVVATLDADLQNDPADLPRLEVAFNRGADFVLGCRRRRNDPFIKKISSRISNAVRRAVLNDPFHDINCGLRLFKKSCLTDDDWFEGAHRFWPFLATRHGKIVVEVDVNHRARYAGHSKYGIANRLFAASRDLWKVRASAGRIK